MENKFAIGIPTLNRFDLLHPALMFYIHDFPNTTIYVMDNGNQGVESLFKNKNVVYIDNKKNIGVADSWNNLCYKIFEKNDYAIILNDDIYLGRKEWEFDNLLSNYKKDFYVGSQDWCSFILPKKTFFEVGEFDKLFYPAYYEDNDYAYRMKLLNKYMFKIPFLNPFLYQSSKTIEKDPSLRKFIEQNKSLYLKKWGGLPNKEVFKTAYNI